MYLTKRNGIYQVFYNKPDGKLTSVSTKTKLKKEALEFLSEFEAKLKERRKLKYIPITLKEYTWEYLKYSESVHRPKTSLQFKTILNSLRKFTGDVQLTSVTMQDLQNYLITKSRVSPYTAQKHLAYLKSAFKRAIDCGYLIEDPCQKIKPFKLPEKQPLYFTEADFNKLLSYIDDKDLKDLVQFSINVGCRQMELITLKWRQVDFDNELLLLDNRNGNLTKSKRVRAVPLTTQALQILKERYRSQTCDYVFTYQNAPISQDFISKKFKKYVIRSGINPALHFHSLRHSYATWLVQKGASIYEVSKLLGHADIKTTEIYSHIRADELKATVGLLNKQQEKPIEGPDFVI